ncbi:MAG: YeeE/YedE thiosulfate transporter family protein [Bacteroidota bacterium]
MLLLVSWGKTFGVSSNLRTLCSVAGAGKYSSFFRFEWKDQIWNLVFILGAIIGGYIARTYLVDPSELSLSIATVQDLKEIGISYNGNFLPLEYFNWSALSSFQGMTVILIGGFAVGFGTRYAGGCTSGHAITGLSNLQVVSLIAVIGFFAGGLITTHLLFPLIF